MHRACELKDQTYKKTRTLHFSEYVIILVLPVQTRNMRQVDRQDNLIAVSAH